MGDGPSEGEVETVPLTRKGKEMSPLDWVLVGVAVVLSVGIVVLWANTEL